MPLASPNNQLRRRVALYSSLLLSGAALVLIADAAGHLIYELGFPISLVGVTIFVVAAFRLLMIYLQTGFKGIVPDEGATGDTGDLPEGSLATRLSALEQNVEELRDAAPERTSEQYLELLEKSVKDVTTLEEISVLRDHLHANEFGRRAAFTVQYRAELIVDRLATELGKQSRRASLNLLLGLFTAAFGFVVLWNYIPQNANPADGWIHLIQRESPRYGLVFFIEILAYFFLRLYSSAHGETKYYHNEITTLEARLVSLQISAASGDSKALSDCLRELTRTERNRVLKKGETTADTERAEWQSKILRQLSTAMLKPRLRRR